MKRTHGSSSVVIWQKTVAFFSPFFSSSFFQLELKNATLRHIQLSALELAGVELESSRSGALLWHLAFDAKRLRFVHYLAQSSLLCSRFSPLLFSLFSPLLAPLGIDRAARQMSPKTALGGLLARVPLTAAPLARHFLPRSRRNRRS